MPSKPALPSDLTELTAALLSQAIRNRDTSCYEVMQAYTKRIAQYNPVYNAIVSMLDTEHCLELAKEADRALDRGEYWGWMHGMPHAIKDLANAHGFPTSMGSPLFAGSMAAKDDLLAARIRSKGAIFIGKTNTPEFGMGSQTYNPVFGATGSAYNPGLTAGGSSGGAACALGTRMLPVADGGDLMGSLRNPAAFNNVIGFRPSQGRVPSGQDDDLFYQQLGTLGPMGRNTRDTILLLDTIAGHNAGNPMSLRDALPPPTDYTALELSNLRIGWLGDYDGYLAMESGVLDVCQANLKLLSDLGAIVENCRPQFDMQELWQTWLTLRHWMRNKMHPLYEDPDSRALLKPEAIWEIEGSYDLSAKALYRAGLARTAWYRAISTLLEKFDFLVLPSAQVFPFAKQTHWPESVNGKMMDTYHRWMEVVIGPSLAGLPVVNVPAGFDLQGRPMGMQLIGAFGEDQGVLEFALAYEEVTDHLAQRPVLAKQNQNPVRGEKSD